ncbi:MAG: hypothetical protein LBH60_03260, partial [Prevotellaceae bacterium]|nr:hypothetical protein [Prevotellaceae bacterium]
FILIKRQFDFHISLMRTTGRDFGNQDGYFPAACTYFSRTSATVAGHFTWKHLLTFCQKQYAFPRSKISAASRRFCPEMAVWNTSDRPVGGDIFLPFADRNANKLHRNYIQYFPYKSDLSSCTFNKNP